MILAVAPGARNGFKLKNWRDMFSVSARREGKGGLRLDVRYPAPGGSGRDRSVLLQLGGSLSLRPGTDVDPLAVGMNKEPIKCTWVE